MGKIKGWKKISYDIVTPRKVVYKRENREEFVTVEYSVPLDKWLLYHHKRKRDGSFLAKPIKEKGYDNKMSAIRAGVSFMKRNNEG